jgi:hypothetical protein
MAGGYVAFSCGTFNLGNVAAGKESIMQIFDVEFEATEVLSSPSLAMQSPLQSIFVWHEQRGMIDDPGCSTRLPSP